MNDEDELTPTDAAKQLLEIIYGDQGRLEKIDRYLQGDHDEPYMPSSADGEYRLLAQRSVSNRMPLLVSTPAQALYVDDYRTPGTLGGDGEEGVDPERIAPAWDHFRRSRMPARQAALYRAAFSYGHAFLLADHSTDFPGKSFARMLSPLRTAALYEDPANDLNPTWALHIEKWPAPSKEEGRGRVGVARLWDGESEYPVTWEAKEDPTVGEGHAHGAEWCPVTRFAFDVDLEGRTTGLVEPMIVLQDRINQSVFDLLVMQTGGAFNVRWASGMAPPVRRDANGEPILDENGQEIPIPFNVNGKTFLFNEDSEGKFGAIEGTELRGVLDSIESALREWASTSQTPPHHMLGQIANLSAEALKAAESSFTRKVDEFKHAFGESWERHFRVVASMEGTGGERDMHGECIWRDTEDTLLHHAADGLSKLADLQAPKKGLWRRIPGMTATELREWVKWSEEEDPGATLSSAMRRATGRNADALRPPEADSEAA